MTLELWQVLVLAVVQGVTEFLPISSDGHLVVVAALMAPGGRVENLDIPGLVIILHGGTLLSILVFYWRRILDLLRDFPTVMRLAVATIPAVLVGLPIKLLAEHWLGNPVLAGVNLILTGVVLVFAGRMVSGDRHYRQLSYAQSLFIGLAQAVAILPGMSRSGCTISAGLKTGLTPVSAATFSFLMAIPAISGACLLEAISVWKSGGLSIPYEHLGAGIVVSFVVGLLSLWWLIRWLERGRFAAFAWWCIPVGVGVLIWQTLLSRP
jgi:undecaprenyl-diphosphatase